MIIFDVTQNQYTMKIRLRYFFLALILSALVGYAFGCLWPLASVMYPLSDHPVDKGTNLGNFISIFSAIFTFLAVVVALFKDEIVGNFKRADVRSEVLCDTVEEFLNEAQGDKDPSVAKYFNHLVLKNMGNINAQDCELSVDCMSFQGKNDLRPMPINYQRKKVLLDGLERTYIPLNGGKREAELVEITATEDPNGNKKTQLLIAGNPVLVKDGTWTVTFCLNMSNASVKYLKFSIRWNGKWHDHKNNMQIEIKQL